MVRLKLAFMGTPDFAVPSLAALMEAGHSIVAVYTQPPRPAGRGNQPRRSAVESLARIQGLPVRCPTSLRDPAEIEAFRALNLDAAVVVAYGLLLPKAILAAPRLGCINLHASLLPRWRGAAPIQRALLAGDEETGVSVMQMDEGLDSGPVLARERVPIGLDATSESLHDNLSQLGARLLVRTLGDLAEGRAKAEPQADAEATYAKKLTKDDGRIDWARSAAEIERQVRAFHPWPGAWCEHEGRILKLLAVGFERNGHEGEAGHVLADKAIVVCGDGKALRLLEVQPAGKPRMSGRDFINGYRPQQLT